MNSMYLIDQIIARSVREKNEARIKKVIVGSINDPSKKNTQSIDIDLIKKILLESEQKHTDIKREEIIEKLKLLR